MIKKFEEFINESGKFNRYNNMEIRKKFRYDSSLSKYYNKDKGPYMLFIEHGYSGRDIDISKEMRLRPYDYEDRMNKRGEEKINYNMDTIIDIIERDGKTLLTKKDIEDAGLNELMGLGDNEVIIYPFVDYDEAFKFINYLDKDVDVEVLDYDIHFTNKSRDNLHSLFYNSKYPYEVFKDNAESMMDDLMQLFDKKYERK